MVSLNSFYKTSCLKTLFPQCNFYKNLSLHHQVNLKTSISHYMSIDDDNSDESATCITINPSCLWNIQDRILLESSYSYYHLFDDNPPDIYAMSNGWKNVHNFNLDLRYFIEDHLSINNNYAWRYCDSDFYSTEITYLNWTAQIGLTYYFIRNLM